jgi:ERCC4-type nuclease
VGPVMAKRLLERFGTPRNVLASTEAELTAVGGIGMERAQVIREVLERE